MFLGGLRDARNPYFPGWVTYVDEDGDPRRTNVLEDLGPASSTKRKKR